MFRMLHLYFFYHSPMSMLMFDWDKVSSASVANVLSNDAVNWLIDAECWFNGFNISITCDEPETNVGLFSIFSYSIDDACVPPTTLEPVRLPVVSDNTTCADEDIIFFKLLKETGVKLYAHTGALVTHMKTMNGMM